MGHAMTNALTVLLVCFAVVNAETPSRFPVHFPVGKTVTYQYHADTIVKSGTTDPAVPFTSEFSIKALLHVRHDSTSTASSPTYYVTLANVTYGLHNGQAEQYETVEMLNLPDVAKILHEPFLMVYNEYGVFQGVKLMENESGWSKNMKQAIASTLQLDFSTINLETPVKHQERVSVESTIHGVCKVTYDVRPKHVEPWNVNPESVYGVAKTYEPEVFVVTKTYEPAESDVFIQRTFDHMNCKKCNEVQQNPISTICTRTFEIENRGKELLVRKVVSEGLIYYTPWHTKLNAQVATTQTFILLDVPSAVSVNLPQANFQGVPLRSLTYNRPQGNYALHAAEDLTQGRHVVKLDVLIPKLKKMLAEAADYLEENHLNPKEVDFKHGQTMNRILHTMSLMDLGALEQVHNAIHDAKTTRDETVRNIFLQMIPNVGTTAACLFTRNVIRKKMVSDITAVSMLSMLPNHVKAPSETLLLEMEELVKFGEAISPKVRVASILCFATLIHQTYRGYQSDVQPWVKLDVPLVERYLSHFLDHVKNEPSYEMRMTYLMAIKNVQLGNILPYLEGIIRNVYNVSEYPHHIRVQAMWAVNDVLVHNPEKAHQMFWDILTDDSLPISVRIVAYDVLINQLPHTKHMIYIHWLMMHMTNEHIYNYHVTTMKALANSMDPCLRWAKEEAKKILLLTKIRNVNLPLSTKYYVDYVDPKTKRGESWKHTLVLNEATGLIQSGSVEHSIIVGDQSTPHWGIHWTIHGMHDILTVIQQEFFGKTIRPITSESVKNVLLKAANDMPPKQTAHIDVCITFNGHAVTAHHYGVENWEELIYIVQELIFRQQINWQHVVFDELHEEQVATDLGLPVVLIARAPNVMSFKFFNEWQTKPKSNFKVDTEVRMWKHGEHAVMVYNPIADVWHSVRKITSHDVILPFEMNVKYNEVSNSIKITLPRLPYTKLSVGGIQTHVTNYVTVTEDENNVLKQSCAVCSHYKNVTCYEGVKDNWNWHSKDTGLQYVMSVFNCETELTTTKIWQEFYRVMTWWHDVCDNAIHGYILGIRQFWWNMLNSFDVGNCGTLWKVEPSIVHPTSQVEINVRLSDEDLSHVHPTVHTLSNRRINVRGTVDVIAASTNKSARSWDVNVLTDLSKGHISNSVKVRMTRITPGEKKWKICIDGQKNYPVDERIAWKSIDKTSKFTTSKLTITAGETEGEQCVRDDTHVMVTVKGEMSREQMKAVETLSLDECILSRQKSMTSEKIAPNVDDCIQQFVFYSSLRLFTVNVAYKKIPQSVLSKIVMFEDWRRSMFFPHVTYTTNTSEPGTAQIVLEYPPFANHVNMAVITPVYSYEYTELPINRDFWISMMDNVHLPVTWLTKYTFNSIKTCSIHGNHVTTTDNSTLPFDVPNQWTLMSGDFVDQTYAVFVKSVPGGIAVKMFVVDHVLEMVYTSTTKQITVDGTVVEDHEKGFVVPKGQWTDFVFKVSMTNHYTLVQSHYVPVMVFYTGHSVTLMMQTSLQGVVTGICGHLDGTHKETLPKVYSVPTI